MNVSHELEASRLTYYLVREFDLEHRLTQQQIEHLRSIVESFMDGFVTVGQGTPYVEAVKFYEGRVA